MHLPPPGSRLPLNLTEFDSAHEFWERHLCLTRQKDQGHVFRGVHIFNDLPWAPRRDYFRSVELSDEVEQSQPERLVPWEAAAGGDKDPKLEKYIPKNELPEDLLVLDSKDVLTLQDRSSRPSSSSSGSSKGMYRYRRVHPRIGSSSTGKAMPGSRIPLSGNTAELDISHAKLLGSGDHGHVYVGTIKLSKSNRAYRVACKVSYASPRDREMMYNEARTYSLFPRHFQEDWTGYQHMPEAEFDDGDGVFPACAVVSKFYGFYLPVYDWDEVGERTRSRKSMAIEGNYSPIMLLEHCGSPIDPAKLTAEQRTCCYAFAARMHYAGFLHNSFHIRNILMQPGPLHLPPSQRSLSTPSFRLIDFGRTEYFGKSKQWKDLIRLRHRWDATQNADFDGRDTDTEMEDDSDDVESGEDDKDKEREKEREWKRIREWLYHERRDAMNALYGWVEKRIVSVEYQGVQRQVGFYYRSYD